MKGRVSGDRSAAPTVPGSESGSNQTGQTSGAVDQARSIQVQAVDPRQPQVAQRGRASRFGRASRTRRPPVRSTPRVRPRRAAASTRAASRRPRACPARGATSSGPSPRRRRRRTGPVRGRPSACRRSGTRGSTSSGTRPPRRRTRAPASVGPRPRGGAEGRTHGTGTASVRRSNARRGCIARVARGGVPAGRLRHTTDAGIDQDTPGPTVPHIGLVGGRVRVAPGQRVASGGRGPVGSIGVNSATSRSVSNRVRSAVRWRGLMVNVP